MVAEAVKLEENFTRQSYDIIVVGTGPVGIRAVQELQKLNSSQSVAVFGDEPWQPYNRVQLSSLISGEIKEESIYASYDLSSYPGVSTFYNNKITEIDRYSKTVVDSLGKRYSYEKLILATGSQARIPAIKGIELDNIFTFRDLNDAQSLMSRSVSTRKTVVIGGGLLGLETARAMQRFNTEVHVIEHSMWLMFNQLDNRAGSYLTRHVETLGIQIHVQRRAIKFLGDTKVTGVLLDNDQVIECDTVIIAAGIIPNSKLALDAGLHIGKGIRVDDHMQTHDANIFAIGECAEHKGKVYGLVGPGLEQAAVVAHYINGEKTTYRGSISATNLKVMDYPVFSAGDTGSDARAREEIIYQDHQKEIYRKILVINGRIRGAVGIGEWPGVNRFQEAVESKRRLWPWQINRFRAEGKLWNDSASESVIDWPATAVVCNCTGVTRGQLDDALKRGAHSVFELANVTGASSVCGSCKPLIKDFIGGSSQPEPTKGFKTLISASVLSIIATFIILFLPALYYSQSVQTDFNIDALWRDNLFKQISGYSLLGLALLISVISIRKRLRKILNLWDYAYWRVIHVIAGFLSIGVLLAHTGFRFGDNLNFYLMLVFSSLLLVGAIAGATIGYEHNLPRRFARQLRMYAVWSHILLLWPLPALLGFHIIKTYYF